MTTLVTLAVLGGLAVLIYRARVRLRLKARAFIRWAFYSKRNFQLALGAFVGALIALSVLSAVVGALTSGGDARATAGQAARQDSAPLLVPDVEHAFESPSGAQGGAGSDDTASASDAQIAREVRARAEGFARAYFTTGPGWAARVHPFVSPALWETMQTANTARIPDTTGVQAYELKAANPFAAQTRVTMIGGTVLDIGLGWDGANWFVTTLDTPGPRA